MSAHHMIDELQTKDDDQKIGEQPLQSACAFALTLTVAVGGEIPPMALITTVLVPSVCSTMMPLQRQKVQAAYAKGESQRSN